MRLILTRVDLPRILATALALALAAACGADDGTGAPGTARVIATTSILADVTQEVAGSCAAVEALVPAGADPHEFEPTAQQIAELHEADLVVAFGLGLEQSLEPVLDEAGADGTPTIEISDDLDPIPFAGGSADPHVWQDPSRMARAASTIASALSAHTACSKGEVEANAERYAQELRDLDEEIATRLDAIPPERRRLVTNHDSLGYFADRYDFEIVGTVIPGGSTLNEPSSAELADLADLISSTGVPAIFAENVAPATVADALATEVGRHVEVVDLYTDSLGPEGSDGATYVDMMRTNAERIAEALGS